MIIREIVQEPDIVIAIFDFFNDYRDTKEYLDRNGYEELSERLTNAYVEYEKRKKNDAVWRLLEQTHTQSYRDP